MAKSSRKRAKNRAVSPTADDDLEELWRTSPTPPPSYDFDPETRWVVEGIENEQIDLMGIPRYEIKWGDWKDSEGFSSTWQKDLPDLPDKLEEWRDAQKRERQRQAQESTDIDVNMRRLFEVHNMRTGLNAVAFHEKMELLKSRGVLDDDVVDKIPISRKTKLRSQTQDVANRARTAGDDRRTTANLSVPTEPRPVLPLPRSRSTNTTTSTAVSASRNTAPVYVVQINNTAPPPPNATSSRAGSNSRSQSTQSKRQGSSRQDDEWDDTSTLAPSSRASSSNIRLQSPKLPVSRPTNAIASGSASGSGSGSGSHGPSNRPAITHSLISKRKSVQSTWDRATQCAGAQRVVIVNDVDEDEVPPDSDMFDYRETRDTYAQGVPRRADTANCLVSCMCDTCEDATVCGCQDPSELKDEESGENVYAYTPDGLFAFNLLRGQIVLECNKGCSCDLGCRNRVAQRPRNVPLEIFKTLSCGWGARATVDIVRGKVIGMYTGKIIYRQDAKKLQGYRNNYVFDLDWAENGEEVDLSNSYSVDANEYGNWTRFINHSCEPNMEVYPVVFDSIPEVNMYHTAFVAIKDIPQRTELTIDYDPGAAALVVQDKGKGKKKRPPNSRPCMCGAESCRGWLRVLGR